MCVGASQQSPSVTVFLACVLSDSTNFNDFNRHRFTDITAALAIPSTRPLKKVLVELQRTSMSAQL